jgi:putative transposase
VGQQGGLGVAQIITKATRFQIIKPLDATWDELGQVLRDLSYHTTRMCNRAVQLYYENHNTRLQYKAEHGKYPADKDLYGQSFRNHVYHALRSIYPDMASSNVSQTNQLALNRWKNDMKEIMRLQKSIPSFRLGTPVQVANQNYTLLVEEQAGGGADFIADITLLSRDAGKQMRYRILLDGGDRSKKTIFRRVIDGEYKQGAMQIVYNKRKKKWFCVVSFTFTLEKALRELDANRSMGVLFGAGEYAIYAAYSFGRKRYTIPAGEIMAVEKKIHAITERRKAIQRNAGYRGHGRNRKLLSTNNLAGQATNIRDTINHKYSRQIIDIAAANRCGVIRIRKPGTSAGPWPWANLVEKIKYKAEEKGIVVEVVDVDGVKCCKCNADIENTEDNPLTCPGCGATIEKEYNTAKRVAAGN